MTREEAIKVLDPEWVTNEFAKYDEEHGIRDVEHLKAIYNACVLAAAALRDQENRRWIPVAERLPGNDDFVLVIVSGKAGNITLDNAAELASFSMDEGWILEMWPEWEDPKVTYWMPLPEPPKEDE